MSKMKKHSIIIEKIESIENWENEEKFLVDVLVLGSSKLFIKAYEDLNKKSFVSIPPLLRQIQENIVVIIGLTEQVYTMKEFVTKPHEPKTIMNRIKKINYVGREVEFDTLNDYLLGIKKMLSEFSHTNYSGAMSLFAERFQVPESIAFNRLIMKHIMTFLEVLFIAMVNDLYSLKLIKPTIINLKKELKQIGTLKYVTRKFPESIENFINQSETLKKYYSDTIKSLKANSLLILNSAKMNHSS